MVFGVFFAWTGAASAAEPPVNTVPPTISGTAQAGQTLTANKGSWTSSTTVTYGYQWQRCDASGAACVDISGSTSKTRKLASADVGRTLRVRATATNSVGSSSATSDATSIVQALPPSNTSPPTINGSAQDGETLTAGKGTWAGTTPLVYTYQWQRCDATGTSCIDIVGATASKRTLTAEDAGSTLVVRVTADNTSLPGGAAASATSAATGVVQALAPANTASPTVSGDAREGQTLTAVVGSWSGTTPFSYSYQWRRCDLAGGACTDVDGATAVSYPVTPEDVGSTLRVVVTADNSALSGGGAASALSMPTIAVTDLLAGDPVIAAAGDIACDPAASGFKSGLGKSSACRQLYTSNLLVNAGLAAVLPLGDNQYDCSGFSAFSQSYGPSWGRLKASTRPAIGNHEYLTSGGTDCDTSGKALGYFQYFGDIAGDPSKGYYSYDIGTWHVIALNSNNTCMIVSCSASSAQERWLKADLAAHPNLCTLAYWHAPRFYSGATSLKYGDLWNDLYAAGADIVLNGHVHNYERLAAQDPSGAADPDRGIREFVVGTGGGSHAAFPSVIQPNSEVRDASTFGVLKLTLHPTSYDWSFEPEAGKTFTDSGSGTCH